MKSMRRVETCFLRLFLKETCSKFFELSPLVFPSPFCMTNICFLSTTSVAQMPFILKVLSDQNTFPSILVPQPSLYLGTYHIWC